MKSTILFLAFGAMFAARSHAAIDRNGNGLDDVWEIIYGASALTAANDADGDGYSNAAEALAGTNPFDPSSVPSLRLGFLFPSVAQLAWDSFPGKRYTIQSRSSLAGDTWTNAAQLLATDTVAQTNLANQAASKFFRLAV